MKSRVKIAVICTPDDGQTIKYRDDATEIEADIGDDDAIDVLTEHVAIFLEAPRASLCFFQTSAISCLATMLPFEGAYLRRGQPHTIKTKMGSSVRDTSSLLSDDVMMRCDPKEIIEDLKKARALASESVWTAGALAFNMLSHTDVGFMRVLKKYQLTLDVGSHLADAAGAGVIYFTGATARHGVYTYDLNSAYPDAMRKQRLWVGAQKTEYDLAAITQNPSRYLIRLRVRIRSDVKISPCTAAPGEIFIGWVSGWELPLLLAAADDVPRIDEVWAGTFEAPQLLSISSLYMRRKEHPAVKRALNLLSGKLRQRPFFSAVIAPDSEIPEGAQILLEEGATWRRFLCHGATYREPTSYGDEDAQEGDFFLPTAQPIAAAAVLGYVRARMYKCMQDLVKAGHKVYYADTDSIHTDATPQQFSEATSEAIGPLLGQFKTELECAYTIHAAPKIWMGESATSQACKYAFAGLDLERYCESEDDETHIMTRHESVKIDRQRHSVRLRDIFSRAASRKLAAYISHPPSFFDCADGADIKPVRLILRHNELANGHAGE